MSKDKVLIMMSTYNGEKYLAEQLESCLQQKDVAVDILVRDDGSKDGTVSLLEKYCQKYENVRYYVGDNCGVAKSFLNLVERAEDSYDYYAFCDQDDVWDADKMKVAVDFLKQVSDKNLPGMYYCGVEMVDKHLHPIGENFKPEECTQNLKKTLHTFGVIKGCTMVINVPLMQEIKKNQPSVLKMHDDWIHKVCLSLQGSVIGDSKCHMKYRMHEDNVTGSRKVGKRFRKLLHIIFSEDKCVYSKMAKELIEMYGERLSEKDFEALNRISNYKKNWKNRWGLLKEDCSKVYLMKREFWNLKFRIMIGIF